MLETGELSERWNKRIKAFHELGLNILSSTVAIGLLTKIRLEHIQTLHKCIGIFHAPQANKLQWKSVCAERHGGENLNSSACNENEDGDVHKWVNWKAANNLDWQRWRLVWSGWTQSEQLWKHDGNNWRWKNSSDAKQVKTHHNVKFHLQTKFG